MSKKQKGGEADASVFMAGGYSGKCWDGGVHNHADPEEVDGAGEHVRNAQPGSSGRVWRKITFFKPF